MYKRGGVEMSMQFKMPENTDIEYKFFNGKWSMKDLMTRSIGLAVGVPISFLVYMIISSTTAGELGIGGAVQMLAPSIICWIVGWIFMSMSAYDGTMKLHEAIRYEKIMEKKNDTLINRRQYNFKENERDIETYDEKQARAEV